MNALGHFRWLACTAMLGTVVFAAEKTAPKSAPAPASVLTPGARFKQIRDRAAALYQHRNQAPPAATPEENPFRTAISAPVRGASGPASDQPEVGTTPTQLAVLQQAVATLRVHGFFEKDGESYLVINGKSYRVGDVVQAVVRDETVYLRVREIGRNSVTLALNDTEITLKHGTRVAR